mmetsp:Transcript_20969/g.70909  ORF Transcript_20969/g.70909 Transcript_20969/m.70909 type:complete len:193 (-) Transcript_20969:324-902(-)
MSKLATALLACFAAVHASVEPRTGISFPDKHKGGSLSRLGVRTKGPIKVYAVGEYDSGTFLLRMSYGVGAQKMASALADALKPRCKDAKQIEEFEACLLSGLPNGAPKGTELEFATGGSKLSVSVNQKPLGAVGSKALCSAFAAIYTDRNAVCTMNAAGEGAPPAACGLLSPARKGALVGAGVGYLAGKVLG